MWYQTKHGLFPHKTLAMVYEFHLEASGFLIHYDASNLGLLTALILDLIDRQ